MKRLRTLYDALDHTTSTNTKIEAMVAYFASAPPEDAAWGLYFLTGRRPKRLVSGRDLWGYALHHLGGTIPDWLFAASYEAVGDIAETIALLLEDEPEQSEDIPLGVLMRERLLVLDRADDDTKREAIAALWRVLRRPERFLLHKLLTGELRVGVSQTLAVRALAKVTSLPPPAIAHRLMGTWEPTAEAFLAIVAPDFDAVDPSRPYPFYLASQTLDPSELGDAIDFFAEWKWDGIRAQLIRRDNELFIWSRGEELMTDRFPELHASANAMPNGTVLDGEILAWDREQTKPMAFAAMQQRTGRKKLSTKTLDGSPVVFIAYDLLERDGQDVRALPLTERRAHLEALLGEGDARIFASPLVHGASWDELRELREQSRERRVEGLMLKRKTGAYRSGRPRGDFYKWKIDPMSIDAVLLYAQAGSGRRSNLFTDYTFGVWHEGALVPVAKAYSGLTDVEIAELDRWIRGHTVERFGPVRQVAPEHVFELAFEGIQESTRHKSGIALRFPRIARWRTDKKPADADDLMRVRAILTEHSQH